MYEILYKGQNYSFQLKWFSYELDIFKVVNFKQDFLYSMYAVGFQIFGRFCVEYSNIKFLLT
jgi:hypothetical protein